MPCMCNKPNCDCTSVTLDGKTVNTAFTYRCDDCCAVFEIPKLSTTYITPTEPISNNACPNCHNTNIHGSQILDVTVYPAAKYAKTVTKTERQGYTAYIGPRCTVCILYATPQVAQEQRQC